MSSKVLFGFAALLIGLGSAAAGPRYQRAAKKGQEVVGHTQRSDGNLEHGFNFHGRHEFANGTRVSTAARAKGSDGRDHTNTVVTFTDRKGMKSTTLTTLAGGRVIEVARLGEAMKYKVQGRTTGGSFTKAMPISIDEAQKVLTHKQPISVKNLDEAN